MVASLKFHKQLYYFKEYETRDIYIGGYTWEQATIPIPSLIFV